MMISRTKRGFTLIELMVSVAIFAMVMLLAVGAYISLLGYIRQARATSILMTNLSFAVDNMAREIRTGTSYSCNPSGAGGDCTTGGTSFGFTDQNGNAITYWKTAKGTVGQCENDSQCGISLGQNAPSDITDPSIYIQNLSFYVRGTGSGDKIQPTVTIIIQGAIAVPQAGTTTFSVQSSATQRFLDL